jgi:regulator of ribonuclease activity A
VLKIPKPKLATADLCDAQKTDVFVLSLAFQDYGGTIDFAGPAVTIRTIDDNTKLKELVETKGEGKVIVVDGGGSQRTALLGGNLAAAAVKNGWSGIVISGCVRDRHEICLEDIGIKALGSCPRKSEKLNRGEVNVEISISDVVIKPGYWIIADADGVLVSSELPSL